MSIGSPAFVSTDSLSCALAGAPPVDPAGVVDAFLRNKLFGFSVGGMRPFGALAMELVTMAVPIVRGAVSGDWGSASTSRDPRPKQEVLRLWDEGRGAAEDVVAAESAAALRGDPGRHRYVHGRAVHDLHPLRHRQRGPSSRPGLCVSARVENRAAGILRPELRERSCLSILARTR